MSFGKPKYNKFQKKNRFKIVDNAPNIFRVLPPFGSLADRGEWYIWQRIHWGWTVTSDDGSKQIPRPFHCVEQSSRDGSVTQRCPACDWVEEKILAPYKARHEALEKEGKSDEQIKEALKMLSDARMRYNIDSGYVLNVADQNWQVGLLKIAGKHRIALDKCVRKDCIEDLKIDPIDPEQGLWLEFYRNAPENKKKLQEYTHSVRVATKQTPVAIDGKTKLMSMPMEAPIPEGQLEAISAQCWDLYTETASRITVRDVQRLVESGGDPDVAADVFRRPTADNRPARGERSPAPVRREPPVTPREQTPAPVVAPAAEPVVAPPVAPKPAAVAEDDDEEYLAAMRALEAIRARKAAKAVEAPKPTSAPVVVASPEEDELAATMAQLGISSKL